MRRLDTRHWHRLLAVMLLLAALCGLVALVYVPVIKLHAHYDGHIERTLDRTERYLRIAATRPEIEAQLAKVRAHDGTQYYLKHGSPSLAAAEIQLEMQTLIESLGLKLESTQIAPHRDENGRRKITVNFRMRGTLAQLQQLLYRQTVDLPYRFIDNLTLQSLAQRGYVPTPGVEPEVIATFDLYGYALLPAQARQAAARAR